MAPASYSSFAFSLPSELIPWLPTWKTLPDSSLGADQVVPLGDVVHHRLLAVNGLAGAERVDRDGLVPVVGRAHDDRVDVVPS